MPMSPLSDFETQTLDNISGNDSCSPPGEIVCVGSWIALRTWARAQPAQRPRALGYYGDGYGDIHSFKAKARSPRLALSVAQCRSLAARFIRKPSYMWQALEPLWAYTVHFWSVVRPELYMRQKGARLLVRISLLICVSSLSLS